jgi:hypothetical protein
LDKNTPGTQEEKLVSQSCEVHLSHRGSSEFSC